MSKHSGRGYTRLGRFVRRGQPRARIRLTLSNNDNNNNWPAFRPETYGDAIILEKVIGRRGQDNRHSVSDRTGKVIYTSSKSINKNK